MTVEIKVLGTLGHRKFAPMTLEEAQDLHGRVERGEIEGAQRGQYFIINENTKRVIGKLDIRDGQKLMFIPTIRGG